jgi:Peptidase A4 family
MRKRQRAGTILAALFLVLTVGAFGSRGAPGGWGGGPAHHRATSARYITPGNPMVAAAGHRVLTRLLRGSHRVVHSLNWSGYAAARVGMSFQSARATFFVPYVDCGSTPNSYSSHWVGLDGLGSSSVEQVGVQAGCTGSVAQYYAWYEMYPNPVSIAFPVHPGNPIVARVSYQRSNRKFVLELTDVGTGRHFRHALRCAASACLRSSAEVISEAPSTASGEILPLADYRAASFTSISLSNARGHRGGLSARWWKTYQIVGVGQSSHQLAAQPTALYQGQAFSVYWFRGS